MLLTIGGFACLGTLQSFQQRPFVQYEGVEYSGDFPKPDDWRVPGEWTFARLMYPPGWNDGYRGRFDGDYHLGLSLWTQDYPRADRFFSQAVRRLTRIQARSVEQVVDLEAGDDVYNWPWLYAVQVGEWGITNNQAKILRDYLLRGGFFMADDFHTETEWEVFKEAMTRVFPDRTIIDLQSTDQVFHTMYELTETLQVPGAAHLRQGYKGDASGFGQHWRAILDDKGRVMVAISYNSDLGDAWEYADDPHYPEKFTTFATQLGLNELIYAMSH
ncbi:MAG TPA: DUF4159 domain-containing protein [Bryobacteraceae bacterium]|jgi:hypothetical protein